MRSRPYILCLSVLASLTVVGQACARGNHAADSAPRPVSPAATVRFDLYQDYFIVAHGSVGPLKNLNFFLDTGTNTTVLDSRITKKLGIRNEEPTDVVIVGGSTHCTKAILPAFEFGTLKRTDLEVITADLSFFQKAFPVRIDAIIGMDMLGPKPFVIDYSTRMIRFGPAAAMPISVPLRQDGGLAVFDAEIDHAPVHLLFDTGASALILFSRVGPRSSGVKVKTELKPGEIGDFKGKLVWLNSLRLGPEEFTRRTALVASNPKPSEFDIDGLMSPTALGISRVSVDLERQVLGFSR
jgi:predicted aspartyl protease